jgi:tRNA (Thr-GGU) A37 N-methylase
VFCFEACEFLSEACYLLAPVAVGGVDAIDGAPVLGVVEMLEFRVAFGAWHGSYSTLAGGL